MLSGLDGSRLPLLQIAVYSRCFVWLWWLTANESISRRLEQVGCCSTSSQNPDRAIFPSASSQPVVVRPLICSNLPLQPQCQDRSYFRSPRWHFISASRHKRPREPGRLEMTHKMHKILSSCVYPNKDQLADV